MKISKQDLRDVSQLIFEGYLSHDVFFIDTYLTIRTLKTEEREQIASTYKYLTKSENIYIIIDILTFCIMSIGGIEIRDKERLKRRLLQMSSFVVMSFYRNYNLLETKTEAMTKIIDYYLESVESKSRWNLYKNSQRIIDFNTLKHTNQFQYYWVALNSYRDLAEQEKREWAKIEYMTNSICAFVNPKAYKKVKSSMGVSEKAEDEFDSKLKFRNRVVSKLEKSSKEELEFEEEKDDTFDNLDQKVFGQLKRKEDEAKNDYVERIEKTMIESLKGDVIDDHDKKVRTYEINLMKRLLLERRVKSEVLKEVRERRKLSQIDDINKVSFLQKNGIFKEEVSNLEGDFNVEETKGMSYYHNKISYVDIVNERAFSSIPEEEKKKAFNLVMETEIDVEKATETFLKNLYKDDKKDVKASGGSVEKQTNFVSERATVGKHVENLDVGLIEKDVLDENVKLDEDEQKIKNAAQLASKMDIDIDVKDLVEQKRKLNKERMTKYHSAIDKRNFRNSDSDQMFFNPK